MSSVIDQSDLAMDIVCEFVELTRSKPVCRLVR